MTDKLSDEIIKILRQFGLPHDGMIRNSDLIKAKIFRSGDYHRQERLQAVGFPPGRWLGANTKIWTPEEVGTYLLNLPSEKPVLPDYAKHPKSAAASKKTGTVKTKRRKGAKRPKRRKGPG